MMKIRTRIEYRSGRSWLAAPFPGRRLMSQFQAQRIQSARAARGNALRAEASGGWRRCTAPRVRHLLGVSTATACMHVLSCFLGRQELYSSDHATQVYGESPVPSSYPVLRMLCSAQKMLIYARYVQSSNKPHNGKGLSKATLY